MNAGIFRVGLRLCILGLAGLVIGMIGTALLNTPSASAVNELNVYLPIIMRGPSLGGGESRYVVLGWNDLGMHCYDLDYSTLAVLPPYNNLWSQVILRGDPPQIVTAGVEVDYRVPNNTYSVGKTNFWDYEDKLFSVDLPANIGLAGKGLADVMDPVGDHFVAEGIPITEFSDGDLNHANPDYTQLGLVSARDQAGNLLAQSQVVLPVSSEMRCDVCHNRPDANNFRMNILLKHDEEEHTQLASQANSGDPVLCSGCHADPALNMPGKPGVPSLSAAMHGKHEEEANTTCYSCHPGPKTQCLRGTMANDFDMTCEDCHVGGMRMLANEDRTPWVDEPRCGNCHDPQYAENPGLLYRQSKGHGGLYCEACHNGTHAILPSRDNDDNLQAIALQGYAGPIKECTICHLTDPGYGGPHQ